MDKEKISLPVNGLKIRGELYIPTPPKKGHYPALCLCHGIPGPTKLPADRGYPALAQRFCAEGFMVLFSNFRGTGESDGNLDLLGWARDLTAAIDFLYHFKEIDKGSISLMGFSGGAAVSIYVAARDHRISSIVTCAGPAEFSGILTPESLSQFVEQARQIGIIKDWDFPPSLDQWAQGFEEISPIKWVDRIAGRPIFIIHGANDEVVDVNHAWRLYHQAKEPKDILIIEGAEHRLRLDEKAISAALAWLKKVHGLKLKQG